VELIESVQNQTDALSGTRSHKLRLVGRSGFEGICLKQGSNVCVIVFFLPEIVLFFGFFAKIGKSNDYLRTFCYCGNMSTRKKIAVENV